jgi:hypothetical protein
LATNETAAVVFARAQSLLNDAAIAGGSVFTDAYLLQPANDAYDWLWGELSLVGFEGNTKRTAAITYDAAEDVLDDLTGWPTDIFLPIAVKFRQNANEEFVTLSRVDDLRIVPTSEQPDRLSHWAFKDRQTLVEPARLAGEVLLDYNAVFAALTSAASAILLDKAVPAMAHYTAAIAAQSVGQEQEARRFFGSAARPGLPGYGAAGFMEALAALWVRNQQHIARRGKPLHQSQGDREHIFPGYFA